MTAEPFSTVLAERASWRARALAAEDALRQMTAWTVDLDPDPCDPAGYVIGQRAQAAVRRAERNRRRSRPRPAS